MQPSYPCKDSSVIIGAVNTADELLSVIRDEIRERGPLTFARFMELALYHPELGYYRTADRFGTLGDFYTAEQLQPVFGELVASFVDKLTKRGKTECPFRVLELGAGRAEMARALHHWGYRAFDWHYNSLPDRWSGLVFANEFFDALPVHLLQRSGDSWKELFVVASDKGLSLRDDGVSERSLLAYAERYGERLPDGGRLEACMGMQTWWERLASMLTAGDVLVIDYGYEASELARLPSGTLMAYRKHCALTDTLGDPGHRDITAHVNFTWMRDCAVAAGFQHQSTCMMSQWVLSVWGEEELSPRWANADQRWKGLWKQLVFGLGETFRVLHFRRQQAADVAGGPDAK
jgi:SAM-dependent MidA family methyltransferase